MNKTNYDSENKNTNLGDDVSAAGPQTLLQLLKLLLKGMIVGFRNNIPIMICLSLLTWLVHTYLLVVKNEGFYSSDPQFTSMLALKGAEFSGTLFWTLLGMIIMNIFYKVIHGRLKHTIKKIKSSPKWVRQSIGQAGSFAFPIILGASVLALYSGIKLNNPLVNLQLAFLLTGAIIAQRDSLLALALRLSWSDAHHMLKNPVKKFKISWAVMAIIGGAIGFILAMFLADNTFFSYLVVFIIMGAIIALIFKKKDKTGGRAVPVLLIFICICIVAMIPAFADDGGWQESGGTFEEWIMSEGALIAISLGLPPAMGMWLGLLIGLSMAQGIVTIGGQSIAVGGDTIDGTSITPLIDENGEELERNDEGEYRWDVPGEKTEWLSREDALERIEEEKQARAEKDQGREEFWNDVESDRQQRIEDRADRLRNEGFVYDPEQDAWVPGEGHPETIAKQRLEEGQRLNEFIERNVDDPTRTDFLQDLVDRVRINGGDMEKLRNAITGSTVGAAQQLSMGEAESALAEADAWKKSEEYAAGVRDWSQRANRVIGRFVPGAGPIINAIQGATYGTVQGYEKGGWRGAFTSAAAQATDELVEQYTKIPGVGSAFHDAYGTKYEMDKDGNWISPIDRFAGSLWHGVSDQYDPRVYMERLQKADGIGDFVDIGLDALDAKEDIQEYASKIHNVYDQGVQIGDRDENLPIIDGEKDGEFSQRRSDEEIDITTRKSDGDLPDGPMTEKTQRMADGITIDDDGKPHANLDDVLEIQRSTQDTRSLKGDDIDPRVQEAFNNTLREKVYEPHDDALIDYVRDNVPGMEDREIKVHDFRTPGADAGSINTDRDYRVLYEDDNGNWIEVPRRQDDVTSVRAEDGSVNVVNKETVYDWEKFSQDKFAELTGYDSDKVRDSLPTESQRQVWDNMSDADKKANWAEMHSQAATDKYHIEASPDYSDQGLSEGGDRIQKIENGKPRPNILDVEDGRGTLDDPRALADMYHEKADVYLRQGNEAEAIAQIKKSASTLDGVREGYESQGLDVGELPADIRRGMDIINEANVDHRADPADVEQQLRDANFDGIDDFNKKLGGQIESVKFAQEPSTSITPEPPSVPETSGVSRTSISTRIHWQDFKETEVETVDTDNSFVERSKDFMSESNE